MEMFFFSLPPPTEKTNTASRALIRLTLSQLAYELSHPSSLIRAVFAPRAAQAARHDRLRRREPLRLAWSGRLNWMKGADQLPAFAVELKKLGVPFQPEIFGGGTLEASPRKEVKTLGLGDCVDVKGFVDFYKMLTPHMQHEIDIWVCPHPQADPAGAYVETFGSGLPIIGDANEAFAGLLRRGGRRRRL